MIRRPSHSGRPASLYDMEDATIRHVRPPFGLEEKRPFREAICRVNLLRVRARADFLSAMP